MMNIALVLSGGTGTRLGASTPKQYLEAGGKPVIAYCLETILKHTGIDAVQVVADSMWHDLILSCIKSAELKNGEQAAFSCSGVLSADAGAGHPAEEGEQKYPGKFRGFSAPGKTRQLSVLNGLEDILQYASGRDCVLIHDAARPMLSSGLISACLSRLEGHDGVLPVLPMKDTVYYSEDQRKITSLLERQKLFAGQAPEAFWLGAYYEANRRLLPDRIVAVNGSAEPAVMAGMDVVMIPGEEGNFKITTIADLERFRERKNITGDGVG